MEVTQKRRDEHARRKAMPIALVIRPLRFIKAKGEPHDYEFAKYLVSHPTRFGSFALRQCALRVANGAR